jgi:hypothetical protein
VEVAACTAEAEAALLRVAVVMAAEMTLALTVAVVGEAEMAEAV